MKTHRRAKLGLAGRRALVEAIEGGMSQKQAAACFCVSPATANRWWRRWREAGEAERRSLACLFDRSSRPLRQPRRLSAAEEEPILRARRETNFGPHRLAGIVRRARSTVWKVLHRHGLSRRRRGQRQTFRRYEWSRPGALLHIDVKRLPRFDFPGHTVTGDRSRRNRGQGHVWLHVVEDDNSRYVHVEQHPREDAETNAACLERALAEFQALGIGPTKALMSDNAKVYGSDRFQAVLRQAGIRHILTPPYTPRWNGKVERFIRTLQEEWAYAHSWPNSTARSRALRSYVRYYNRQRPHSSIGDRPPISRVHNLRGQDS